MLDSFYKNNVRSDMARDSIWGRQILASAPVSPRDKDEVINHNSSSFLVPPNPLAISNIKMSPITTARSSVR